MKSCPLCNMTEPEVSFYKKDTKCKTCLREAYAIRYLLTKDELAAKRNGNPGHMAKCREYYYANKAKVAAQKKTYRGLPETKEQTLARRRAYYAENKEHIKDKAEKWAAANPAKRKEIVKKNSGTPKGKVRAAKGGAARRAQKLNATARWSDDGVVAFVYASMKYFKNEGLDVEVDHVIPLRGKNVCGLHVHNNLRVTTTQHNRAKGNKHD